MAIKLMTDMDLKGKRVVIREDFNVPLKDGRITNDKRIRAALPGIRLALEQGASVLLLSHLGRPVEGEFDPKFSLAPIAKRLEELLGVAVPLFNSPEEARLTPGGCALCENIRFFKGEKKNSEELAKKLAALADVYVMDAFGAAHRAHASTEGALRLAPVACAGPLMAAEIAAFAKVQDNPRRPLAAIIGGSKVSTKLGILENLLNKVDRLIVGGGIANTFLAAAGFKVGKSLMEEELLPAAVRIMEEAKAKGKIFPLPVDVVVAPEFAENQQAMVCNVDAVPDDQMILDIGPKTVAIYADLLKDSATIVWNGPVGAFEIAPFDEGTKELGKAIAASSAFTVVGGGDSVAAVEKYNLADKMGYISTGGGAALELLEGKVLPSIAALEQVDI